MIEMEKANVVKIVENEEQAALLCKVGFTPVGGEDTPLPAAPKAEDFQAAVEAEVERRLALLYQSPGGIEAEAEQPAPLPVLQASAQEPAPKMGVKPPDPEPAPEPAPKPEPNPAPAPAPEPNPAPVKGRGKSK